MAKICLLDTANRLIGFEQDDPIDGDVVVPDDSDLATDGSYVYMAVKGCFFPELALKESGNWVDRKGRPMGAPRVTIQEINQARADRALRKMRREKRRNQENITAKGAK